MGGIFLELQVVKLSPTQNMTILVETPLPRSQYQAVAQQLMAYEHLHAEQVGFLEAGASPQARARLEMMGGEFCGNALMSAAALLHWQSNPAQGDWGDVALECSGADGVIHCRAALTGSQVQVTLPMPLPRLVEQTVLCLDGQSYPVTVVHFHGITHIVLPQERVTGDSGQFSQAALAEWGPRFDVDACGLLLFDQAACSLLPLVYVKLTDSLVRERGCGSGSAAVGAHLAALTGRDVHLELNQPGGVICVCAKVEQGALSTLSIAGNVSVVARGTAYV